LLSVETEISRPADANPIKFEALALEFRGGHLKLIGGTDVRRFVKEPMHVEVAIALPKAGGQLQSVCP
jgi:hypothetical protein